MHEQGQCGQTVVLNASYGTITFKPTCLRKTRNLILFAIVVILGQIGVSISLKRYGWIERDINEIVSEAVMPQIQHVSETVVPQLQYQFEQRIASWPQFNESLYWLGLNQSISMGYSTQERLRPGFQLAEKGVRGEYPVVMIPGFVTSGLEVWGGKECAKKYFRQRMVGLDSMTDASLQVLRTLTLYCFTVGWCRQRPALAHGTALRDGAFSTRPTHWQRPRKH